MVEKPPDIKTPEQLRAGLDELSIQRAINEFFIDPANYELLERDPGEVFAELASQLPDTPKIVNREEAIQLQKQLNLINGQPSAHDHGEVQPLEAFLLARVSIRDRGALEFNELRGTSGEYFSPADSIHMIRDTVRTKRFLEGVRAAVEDKLTRTDGPVYVCDAGSGSLPILGIQAALLSDRVQCVCLESNPYAARIAMAAISSFGLQDRVLVLPVDALEFEARQPFDVVVSETMDVGLLNEPMCDILEHMKSQAADDAHLLPKQVSMFAAAIDEACYQAADQYTVIDQDVKPVIETDWIQTGVYQAGQPPPHISATLPTVSIDSQFVMVSSQVEIFDGVTLLDLNESRLTVPQIVSISREAGVMRIPGGSPISISYSAGASPFDIELKSVH